MIKYTKATVSIKKNAMRGVTLKAPNSIVCNVCGEKIKNDSLGYLDNYISVKKKWEYGTKYDGEHHSIDICETCYENFLSTLKIPAKMD